MPWSKSHLQKWTSLLWSSSTLCSSSFVTSSSSWEVLWWFHLLISSAWQLRFKRLTKLSQLFKSSFKWWNSSGTSSPEFQFLWWIQEVTSITSGLTTLDQTLSKSSLLRRSQKFPLKLSASWLPSVINTTKKRLRPSIALRPSPKSEKLTRLRRTSSTCSSVSSALALKVPWRTQETPD